MNGPHDLGGQMGFGPIAPEPNEPVFHHDWERRAFAISIASGAMGHWNIDACRHGRERIPPAQYLSSSYYELWIEGLERILLKHAVITDADLRTGKPIDPAPTPKGILTPAMVDQFFIPKATNPYGRPLDAPPRFTIGEAVRTRNINPTGHTRLPRYTRGKLGKIVDTHGGFVFPDSNAHYAGDAPQHLYTVEFTATELWGPDGDPRSTVSIDAWESYLEPA